MARATRAEPTQVAAEIISDFLATRCGVRPHYAWLTALELMDRLDDEGWRIGTDDSRRMYVWAWLLEHGLHVRDEDVSDPDLRVTLDMEVC